MAGSTTESWQGWVSGGQGQGLREWNMDSSGRLGGNGWRKASRTPYPVSVTPTQINELQDALGVGQPCSGPP